MKKRELTKDEQKVRDSIKAMTKLQRLRYYTDLYKFHALAVVVVIIMIISIIHSVATSKDTVLYLGILNKSDYSKDYMVDSFAKYNNLDLNKQEIVLHDDLGTSSEYYSGAYNLLSMYIAADEINLVFTDDESFDFIGTTGVVVPPEIWMEPEVYEFFKENIIEIPVIENILQVADENPNMVNKPVVLDIKGTKLHELLGLDDDTRYVVCFIYKGFEQQLQDYSRYLYDLETSSK